MIDGDTQLLGLLGWPVSHSFSPAMHNAAAAAAGLNWVYLPLPVHPLDLSAAVPALPLLGFRGLNVTVPHKQTVMPLLDQLAPETQAIGAVNTIVFSDNGQKKLVGYNTDSSGFLADLAALGVAVHGRECLVLGAGGSARAVSYALAGAGAVVTVLSRRAAQAEELVAALRPFLPRAALVAGPLTSLAARSATLTAPLIVNTTPLGMKPAVHNSIWPVDHPFPPGAFVYDLVYNPSQTQLIQSAEAAGCRAVNGRGMLVHQGAAAFALWTGIQPDIAVMSATVHT